MFQMSYVSLCNVLYVIHVKCESVEMNAGGHIIDSQDSLGKRKPKDDFKSTLP